MTRHRLPPAACVPLALLLAACGGAATTSGGAATTSGGAASTSGAATTPSGTAVRYTVARYTLAPLTVAPGAVVEVVDGDDEPHTVTAGDGSFDTGSFDRDHPGRFTAPIRPGSYAVTCTIHPSMHGTLTVR